MEKFFWSKPVTSICATPIGDLPSPKPILCLTEVPTCASGGPVGPGGTLSGSGTGTFLPFSGVDEQSRSLGTAKTDPQRQDELRVVCLSLQVLFI